MKEVALELDTEAPTIFSAEEDALALLQVTRKF